MKVSISREGRRSLELVAKKPSQCAEDIMQLPAPGADRQPLALALNETMLDEAVEPELYHAAWIVGTGESRLLDRSEAQHDEHGRRHAAQHEREAKNVKLAQK